MSGPAQGFPGIREARRRAICMLVQASDQASGEQPPAGESTPRSRCQSPASQPLPVCFDDDGGRHGTSRGAGAGGVLSVVFWQPPVEDSGPWHRLTALTIAAGAPGGGAGNSDSLPVCMRLCMQTPPPHRREAPCLHARCSPEPMCNLAGMGREGAIHGNRGGSDIG